MTWLVRFLSHLWFIWESEEKKEFSDIFIKKVVLEEVPPPPIESAIEKAERRIEKDQEKKDDDRKWSSYMWNIIEWYDRMHARRLLQWRENVMQASMPARTPIHQTKRPETERELEKQWRIKEWAMSWYGK